MTPTDLANEIGEGTITDVIINGPTSEYTKEENVNLILQALCTRSNLVKTLEFHWITISSSSWERLFMETLLHSENKVKTLVLERFITMRKEIASILLTQLCTFVLKSFSSGKNRLECLKLERVPFSQENCFQISQIFTSQLGKLRELSLSYAQIGPSGMEILAKGLMDNHTLETLDLFQNKLGFRSGCKHLAMLVEHNTCLSKLNLSSNDITDEGFQLIAQSLKRNPHTRITNLMVNGNMISDLGVIAVASAMDIGSLKLANFELFGNRVTEVGVRYLMNRRNLTCLRKLALSGNPIGTSGVVAIVNALPSTSLRLLAIRHVDCIYSDILCDRLVEAIQVSSLIDCQVDHAIVSPKLRDITNLLLTRWFRTVIALLSTRSVPRLGIRSSTRVVPLEIIRKVSEALPVQ
jgi:Ran GTPase-activating protein (RanGAP) involved in mRNA processing and transport